MILKTLLTGSTIFYVSSIYSFFQYKKMIKYYEAFEKSPIIEFDHFDIKQIIDKNVFLNVMSSSNNLKKNQQNQDVLLSVFGKKDQLLINSDKYYLYLQSQNMHQQNLKINCTPRSYQLFMFDKSKQKIQDKENSFEKKSLNNDNNLIEYYMVPNQKYYYFGYIEKDFTIEPQIILNEHPNVFLKHINTEIMKKRQLALNLMVLTLVTTIGYFGVSRVFSK